MSLYTVKLQYKIVIEADSKSHAYRKVEADIRKNPGMFIVGTEEGSGESKKKPLWKQFLFG